MNVFIPLLSAVVGGLLVVAWQYMTHHLQEKSNARQRRREASIYATRLALEIVNWLDNDKQQAFVRPGQALAPIGVGHPVYRFAAEIYVNQPDLVENVSTAIQDFQRYTDISRILLPRAKGKKQLDLVDEMTKLVNDLIKQINDLLPQLRAAIT